MKQPSAYIPDRGQLCAPVDESRIAEVEAQLRTGLPRQFRVFLRWADGGMLPGERFIIYSAGAGVHPDETLLSANTGRNTPEPLIFFAREAEEEFVFRCREVANEPCPVYVYEHEENRISKIAPSFSDFVGWALARSG